ncbi:TonB-dependent receptor [Chitinophagales bacterium]|nr:TonB-dependent receptor [Chitinophagales bacterium]
MFNRIALLILIVFFALLNCDAQDCELAIKGKVFDEGSEVPLSFVNVYIQELFRGAVTDDNGHFLLEDICPGHYHLIFSHIGCEGVQIHLDLASDTTLTIQLSHTPTSLGAIIVEGKKEEYVHQPSISLGRKNIEENANQNLSGLLENEAGVHLIKNGSGISKPAVHGLYGNRLTILNNGIAQSGQQWGNDHSPEIDPFSADKIVVLKGASAIEYGGGGIGSVILVEPRRIERDPHLHGQINYVYETNGRGHSLNTRLQKYSPVLAWRINGTLKKYGDKKTANYFLNNTGVREANLSVQLEKSWNDKLFVDFYGSTFNTQLGVLRGSHIGNLTDLEQALSSDVPLFTEPDFSYAIDAPKQSVSHHFVKAQAKYFLNENQRLELVLASQVNNREEFDLRRSGRTDIPALSLIQYTFDSALKFVANFGDNWSWKLANQNVLTDNTNRPETGILPLIPDYISWKSGLFSTLSKKNDKTYFNLGVRYDYEFQNVLTISNSTPREVIKFENNFHNVSGLFAFKWDVTKTHAVSLNTGFSMRNPAINELYSSGLHQGVSGIEEGDITLNRERLLKSTLEYNWLPNANFSLSALAYYQDFKDYIFLNPQQEIRLTIRGAFPVFSYEQTDAAIYGFDIASQFTINNVLFGTLKYSYLRGRDTQNSIPLVFMPPNSFYGSLVCRVKKTTKVTRNLSLQDSELELNSRLVLEQKNILQEQDFVLPPESYLLFGAKASTSIVFSHYKIRCFLKANNIFNVSYRDYLNRQRYFADDIGFSVAVGMNFKF